tara:strand:+ start:41 stop:445 length:405 start_codon:yes stop_codon:yes gene_type:complete
LSQDIIKGIDVLLNEANKVVNTISIKKSKLIFKNNDYLFIDLRDYREILNEGKIPGSYSCPRGMLEFWIDPNSPYHKKIFNQKKTYVFYCASAWRSALATKIAMEMGLKPVVHLEGGYTEWVKQGGKIEKINKE